MPNPGIRVPNTIELLFDHAAPVTTARPVAVLFRSRAQGSRSLQRPASNKRTCTRKLRPSVLKNGFSVTFHLKELLMMAPFTKTQSAPYREHVSSRKVYQYGQSDKAAIEVICGPC
jgi:hypothetical protein